MRSKEQFLPPRTRTQPISLPQEFSHEEMVRDWTLSEEDRAEIENNILAHVSRLPFKHVVPNGTYFIEDRGRSNVQGRVSS
jgi:hypothetical protein